MPQKKPRPLALSPLGSRGSADKLSQYSLHLLIGTRLHRVYSQAPGAPARALSFNPNSDGRASPVFTATGAADPALYAAVDSPQGAVLEMLYHTVLKKYPQGAVVPASIFAHLKLIALELTTPLRMISIEALQSDGILTPPNFSKPRTDYSDTQAIAQTLYTQHKKTAGLCWHSAQGPSVVAVLYESRMPTQALKKIGLPVPLMESNEADFVAEVLAYHRIVIA